MIAYLVLSQHVPWNKQVKFSKFLLYLKMQLGCTVLHIQGLANYEISMKTFFYYVCIVLFHQYHYLLWMRTCLGNNNVITFFSIRKFQLFISFNFNVCTVTFIMHYLFWMIVCLSNDVTVVIYFFQSENLSYLSSFNLFPTNYN